MSNNPYEAATVHVQGTVRRSSSWRMPLTVFFILLGVAQIYVSFLMLHAGVGLVVSEDDLSHPMGRILFAQLMNVLVGIGWIASGIFFWVSKYRKGVYAAVSAAVVFTVYVQIEIALR
jgi:hypothetical protein